ncbi:MAG: ABC transporter ATP-binding protein [candidate division WOR-3 bacterium]|nr:ABC transporter ATP-binding protein [candidate division WOR-3 bacterium]
MSENEVLLEIENLSVRVENKKLLQDIDLIIRKGEVHIIFGPNGSGKSTLVNTIMGLPDYEVTSGDIKFKGKSILNMNLTKRARLGIGLAYQLPPIVEGVPLDAFLKSIKKSDKSLDEMASQAHLKDYLTREVNVGFSGGERKRSELLQLLAQSPQLLMFDEPDSGIDLDNINLIVEIMGKLLQKDKTIKNRENSGIIVTHSGVILKQIHANEGYVMVDGRLICAGPPLDIFDQIKSHGFDKCIREARKNKKSKLTPG